MTASRTATAPASLPFQDMSDEDVQRVLSEYQIGLTIEEARKVETLLGRPPTVVEAVIWGIQGSEHCSYKSSRRFLKNFTTNGKHIILGPSEDSGIVAITDGPKGQRWGLAVTHESHNHPSQIVPFEGAATGVGGTVRDVVCMGARVIGCMDMLRLGDMQTPESRTIAREVMRGIGGYGNPLGVPNLGGDTVFDTSYNSNCLVNAVALGVVREDEIIHSYVPEEAGREGYQIILIGKPTDRSGFGGAAFASLSMEEDKREQNTGAVQEPNPFLERHLLASTYALFDWLAAEGKLDKVSFKDLGAGGVVCASVEQVAGPGCGAEVDLDAVHVSLTDLPPEVIACAETQERLCWICHPDLTEHILRHYNETWDLPSVAEHAQASVIGTVTTDGVYRLTHRNEVVCEAKAEDIVSGLLYERPTQPDEPPRKEPDIQFADKRVSVASCKVRDKGMNVELDTCSASIEEIFRVMLAHPNAASKEPVFKHYDKNIIGNTLVEAGEADAAVIAPLQDLASYVQAGEHPGWELPEEHAWRGVAVAADGNGRYGRISPYWQGVNAAVEAMRNVAAVGARPRALTDCLNYGNPELPEQLWALEQGVQGIADAAVGVHVDGEPVPIISGNVSLYNGKPDGSAIDPTAIVCCVGVMADARQAVSMQITQPDLTLLHVGERKDECGGSLYYEVLEQLSYAERDAVLGCQVPQPELTAVAQEIAFMAQAIEEQLVHAAHDISEGGLLLAVFEMLTPQRRLGGNIGAHIDLAFLESNVRPDALLFSETGGFLLAVTPDNASAVKQLAATHGVPVQTIGSTSTEANLTVTEREEPLLAAPLSELLRIWSHSLNQALQ